MAETQTPVVVCPKCDKKFKGKSDLAGKKIKCPFCTHAFVVPKNEASEAEARKAAAPSNLPSNRTWEDEGDDPYAVKENKLNPRCPNCANDMADENAYICLFCGYNTLTRAWGSTKKVHALTGQAHFIHLLPALITAFFVGAAVIFVIWGTVVSPTLTHGTWLAWTNHESIKMWTTFAVLFLVISPGGFFCFRRFIEKPKPDEIPYD